MEFERSKAAAKRATAPVAVNKVGPQPPEEPDPASCCGNDCQRCVWIVYWEELQAWEQAQA